jgi:AbrB family looped-hinge helix DNA binding protein
METSVKLAKGGRVVIPASVRRKMGVVEGDELILRFRNGRLEILTSKQAIHLAQDLVQRYVKKERDLAKELIADRRREAADD